MPARPPTAAEAAHAAAKAATALATALEALSLALPEALEAPSRAARKPARKPALDPAEHRRQHRRGVPAGIASDPAVAAFVRKALERLTYAEAAAAAQAAFPGRSGLSATSVWRYYHSSGLAAARRGEGR